MTITSPCSVLHCPACGLEDWAREAKFVCCVFLRVFEFDFLTQIEIETNKDVVSELNMRGERVFFYVG